MPLSRQEAYDGIVAWFSRPGATLGYDAERDVCVYRGDGRTYSKTRCAAGCLIPDDLYNPGMENKVFMALFHEFPALRVYFGGEDSDTVRFIAGAQQIHDNEAGTPQDFLAKLSRSAGVSGLTI